MAFVTDKKAKRPRADATSIKGNIRHQTNDVRLLNDFFYQNPPDGEMHLMEIEQFALDRLRMLKEIEAQRDMHGKNTANFLEFLEDKARKQREGPFPVVIQSDSDRLKDHVSHFIMRLAFCRSPEAQKWMIQQELELFRFRIRDLATNDLIILLNENGTDCSLVNEEEKEMYSDQLQSVLVKAQNYYQFVNNTDYFKVDFLDAIDLVGARRVFVLHGLAYVPRNDLIQILSAKFRSLLSFGLAHCSRHYAAIGDEERLQPILKKLNHQAYLGKSYDNVDENAVTPEMIDKLSEQSFPLCMRSMHNELRRAHHLRHGARMQYGLFLKGIGLSMDGALAFFRQEFTKNIDADKFEKQYAYNIRHNYGKEGKRANYTPYHCQKIITSNAPAGNDCHGCPFKHWDADALTKRLEKLSIAPERVKTIVNLAAKEGRFDKSCTRVFEATHGLPWESMDQLISHPNQYFDLSRRVVSGGADKIKKPNIEDSICSYTEVKNSASQASEATTQASEDVDMCTDDELLSLAMEN